MYADYTFYTGQFGGSVIPQVAFNRWSNKASKFLDQVTFNRITTVNEDIQMACCEIAEIYYKADQTDGKEVSSESVGSHAISYVETGKSLEAKCYDAAKLYLANTGLLYRGVM